MISINRNGRYSFHIRFDVDGVGNLIAAFQSALEGEQGNIELEAITNIDNKKIASLVITCNNQQDKLSFVASSLILELEDEVINYILDRLIKCRVGHDFYPAEFCEVSFGKNDVTIYGFLEK